MNVALVIGKNIRKYRELRAMTREQLAEALGIDTQYLGQCERGERKLGLEKTIDMINYFGISANDMIPFEKEADTFNKDQYIKEINDILADCTGNQLLIVLNSMKSIIPYLK